MEKKNWPVIEIEASGKSQWMGGAYSHVFVYSNKGNFLVKGYVAEVEEYLKKRIQNEGLKFFCNKVLFGGRSINFKTRESKTMFRDIWDHSDEKISLYEPSPSHERSIGSYRTREVWKKGDGKWTIRIKESKHWDSEILKEIKIKRLPNRYVPELFEI